MRIPFTFFCVLILLAAISGCSKESSSISKVGSSATTSATEAEEVRIFYGEDQQLYFGHSSFGEICGTCNEKWKNRTTSEDGKSGEAMIGDLKMRSKISADNSKTITYSFIKYGKKTRRISNRPSSFVAV